MRYLRGVPAVSRLPLVLGALLTERGRELIPGLALGLLGLGVEWVVLQPLGADAFSFCGAHVLRFTLFALLAGVVALLVGVTVAVARCWAALEVGGYVRPDARVGRVLAPHAEGLVVDVGPPEGEVVALDARAPTVDVGSSVTLVRCERVSEASPYREGRPRLAVEIRRGSPRDFARRRMAGETALSVTSWLLWTVGAVSVVACGVTLLGRLAGSAP